MKSIYVKRIGTIATGAVMLGAALSGAVGAAVGDLNKDFFYGTDMSPKVTLVVGEKAAASDGIAAANIAATIGNLAYTSETKKVESDPVVCETQTVIGGGGGAIADEESVTLSTTSTGYIGVIDQDDIQCGLASGNNTNFFTDKGLAYKNAFGSRDENDSVQEYSDDKGNFKEITTTEVCEARTGEKKVKVLLKGDYVNNQCLLCYDICQDTVSDLKHKMSEKIFIYQDKVRYYEDGLQSDSIDEALKMAVEGDAIEYYVDTDFLPPVFLKNSKDNLIDSRYRGKMIFLGEEYMVKDWDPKERSVKIAKGAERTLDNKAFGGDFTAGDGTYQFKIHRALYSEDKVAGVIVDVKKPDGTEVQVVAQRSLNAVVGNVEIYASNVATAGEFVQTDVKVYDLASQIILEDKEWYPDGKESWYVEIDSAPLGCLVNASASTCETGNTFVMDQINDAGSRFTDYQKVDYAYKNEQMLAGIHLTLKKGYDDSDYAALGVGDKIMFPNDAFYFSYEGFKTNKFVDVRCSGDDKKIEIKKVGDQQLTVSFTNDNGDRYDDVHLDQGPIKTGELFIVGGIVYEFKEAKTDPNVNGELKVKIRDVSSSEEISRNFKIGTGNLDINFDTFDGEAKSTSTTLNYVPVASGSDGQGYITFKIVGSIPVTYDGSRLYLSADDGLVGVNSTVVGNLGDFNIDDNSLILSILNEVNDSSDGNFDGQTENSLVRLKTSCGGGCNCQLIGDGQCQDVSSGETVFIDFYDRSGTTNSSVISPDTSNQKDDWQNSVYIKGSTDKKGILNDEDNAKTLWLPNGGDEITVDYGSDDEIKAVTVCHPQTRVYETYFIGKGKNESKSTVTITAADIGKLIPEIGYTLESFGVSTTGNATEKTEVTNMTVEAECQTNTIMPIGSLVVSDASSPSGNLIIVGGSAVNTMGLTGIVAGDSKVEMSGSKLYVAGYTAAQTQQAANQVIDWLKTNVHA